MLTASPPRGNAGAPMPSASAQPVTAITLELPRAHATLTALILAAATSEERREVRRLRDLFDWLYARGQLALALANVHGGAELREQVGQALRDGDAAAMARLGGAE